MYYRDLVLVKVDGGGIYGNCYGFAKENWDDWVNHSIGETERRGRRRNQRPFPCNGDEYWVSGPKEDGSDRLFDSRMPVIHIDEDVREEYWLRIRDLPRHVEDATC